MAVTISITEDDVFTAFNQFLTGILADGVEIVKAQENRVPEPVSDDWVELTPLFKPRLDTNTVTYFDPTVQDPPQTGAGVRNVQTSFAFHVQLDVHGPNSGDNAAIITQLFRDDYAYQVFTAINPDISPLYCDEPKQMAFINGENQYEDRWIITSVLQYNPVTQTPQDFADAVSVGIISVDAAYPPGA
ncbi:Bacteriophage protein [Pararobbsia alpina]|uniref:phage neck terminator protein n=1 Tax=Pararobbsia alpina TaxID=621374 RepID=UPI0039A413D9